MKAQCPSTAGWPEGMYQMSRVLYRIGRVCFAHRRLVVAVWLVLLVGAGVGMKISGGQLDNTFTIPGSPRRPRWTR